jgi:hypothetical protein
MSQSNPATVAYIQTCVGLGVLWFVWGLKGFWWGLLYGVFWQEWVGYRLAEYLLR